MLWCLEDIQALISTIQFCSALEYPPHLLDNDICTLCFVCLSLVLKRLFVIMS